MPTEPRLELSPPAMTPDSPTELHEIVTKWRAREIFEDFEQLSPPLQEQAQSLVRTAMDGNLSDAAFVDVIALTLHFWRDCNRVRFIENKDSREQFRETVRSIQIDQFINNSIIQLNGIPEATEDTYVLHEPDGS